jgi:Tetratricopeptide repeat/NB-ARC domain
MKPSPQAVQNAVHAAVGGPVIQAGRIAGGVHLHAAPSAPAAATPRQLPAVSAHFEGRRDGLDWIAGQWESVSRRADGGVLVVSGTGGVGKTALALAWLHANADEFPDGQLYADLAGYSPTGPVAASLVLGGFLRGLGIPAADVPAETAERAALLRTITHGRRLAVLADNAVSAAHVRAIAPRWPGCVTLVTTRSALSGLAMDGARTLRLEPWRSEAGVKLLRRMIGGERIDAEPDAALEVARLCGGLPLAVGVAAAKLASRPRWPVGRLAAELAQDATRLDVLSPESQDAVGPVLDGSFRALSPAGATLYRLLGGCPVPWFDQGMVAAVFVGDPAEARAAVDELVDANLLEDLGDRVRFHDLVRLHAARKAEGHDKQDALARLGEYCLRGATRAEEIVTGSHRVLDRDYAFPAVQGPSLDSETAALGWLETRHAGLMAVLEACAENAMHTLVWQLADAMWPSFLRLIYPEDRLRAQQLGLQAARAVGHAAAEGMFLTSLVRTLSGAGRDEESLDYGRQAVAVYEANGDPRGLAQACNGLAKTALDVGDLDQAQRMFARALELREQIGYRRGVYLTLQGLGRVALARNDAERAVGHLRRAYEGLLSVGDHYDASLSLVYLAPAEFRGGRADEAFAQLERGVEAMVGLKSRFGEACLRETAGNLREAQGDRAGARAEYRRALTCLGSTSPDTGGRITTRLDQLPANPGSEDT